MDEEQEAIAGLLDKASLFVSRHSFLVLCCVSAMYFASAVAASLEKPLWHDEIFTEYLSRIPSWTSLWDALRAGTDLNPPFYYLVTKASHAAFGPSATAARAPAILAFWGMGLCLYTFVSRRSNSACGLIAMLAPLYSGAYAYAIEARSYAVVLLFSALSLLLWQTACSQAKRGLALAAIAVSIAIAVSCHYFAFLIAVCLLCGETVRTVIRRKLDYPVIAAVLLGVSPLGLYLPLIRGSRQYLPKFWTHADLWRTSISDCYTWLLFPAAPIAAVLAALVITAFAATRRAGKEDRPWRVSTPELGAILAFAAIPIFAKLATSLSGSPFSERYAIPVVVGFGTGCAVLAWAVLGPRLATLVALVLFVCTCASGMRSFSRILWAQPAFRASKLLQSGADRSLPLIVHDPGYFLQAQYYGSPRISYLTDLNSAFKYQQHDTMDRGLNALSRCAPLQVRDYASFVRQNRRFYVLWKRSGAFGWLMYRLWDEGHKVAFVAQEGSDILFLVELKPEPQ